MGYGGPAGQAGHDLSREQVLALAGHWDDAVLCGVSNDKCKSKNIVYLKSAGDQAELIAAVVPKEANCLVKAWRDRSRPLRSFMVFSIWLALSELPPRAHWKGIKSVDTY